MFGSYGRALVVGGGAGTPAIASRTRTEPMLATKVTRPSVKKIPRCTALVVGKWKPFCQVRVRSEELLLYAIQVV